MDELKQKSEYTVLITGGHLTPALAVTTDIRKYHPDWKIIFVGRIHAREGDRTISEEWRIQSANASITSVPINAGRLRLHPDLRSISSLLKIPIGLIQAIRICRTYRPSVILSFGGYIGFAVGIAGWITGIPVAVHEQTRNMGLANKIISLFAARIFVSFPQAHQDKKTVLTGLPIRPELLHTHRTTLPIYDSGKPLLYIMAGATGSLSLNRYVYDILPQLLSRFTVVHQTGRAWIDEAGVRQSQLPEKVRKSYIAMPYLDVADHAEVLRRCDIVVARSGANTVAEVSVMKKAALFIPLPWSRLDEQLHNARFLVSRGAARLLLQQDMTADILFNTILDVYEKRDELRDALAGVSDIFPLDAGRRIVRELEKVT